MGHLFKKFKTKFRYSLQPVFALLEAKEKMMEQAEWQAFVKRTHLSILSNPEDFLGTDLPDRSLLSDIMEEIFTEFFKDQKIKRKNLERVR